MNCWQCGHELTWGGDHDIDEEIEDFRKEYLIETNLTCPSCDSFVLVYHQKERENAD
tara:strand:- start:13735 stop:13905 length:171 start_codon:yes stop_codon:yes gene_type:complete